MAYKFKDYTKSDDVKKAEAKAAEYDTYTESNAVTDYRNKMTDYETNNKVADWTGGTYGDAVKDAWNNINNRAKFSYDLNGDALYQQYKDKYINQGRLAMADTIGQASAMTGGYGSSYAVTAGSQAYQSHLQNLNDIVPQLYQMAYDRYTQEGQDLKDKYSILNNMYQTEYGEHRDKKSDYYTELGRLTDAYNTERSYDRGTYESDRSHYTSVADNLYNRDFTAHNTAEQNAFSAYQQGVNEYYQGEQLKLQQNQDARQAEQLKLQQNQDARQAEQLKIQQRQLELQEAAATTQEAFGLSFEDSAHLKEMADDKDWAGIDKYISSLGISEADMKKLAGIWLPDSYLKPPTYLVQGGWKPGYPNLSYLMN